MKTRSILLAGILGLSATFAVAQNAPMSQALAAQVQQAANAGDGDRLNQLAQQNPQAAAAIAQAAVQVASQLVATNPAAAARVAAAATQIASSPAVIAAAPAIAAQVAMAASAVASNPTVIAAAPSVVATINANATAIANSPAVVNVAPGAAANVQANISAGGAPASGNAPISVPPNNPVNQVNPDINVSPAGGQP
ncbi:MAG: hypothetical protein Q7S40_32260 [Opitutaceae bacterium]|nr:hypothetical protein [Opitutaceae bacterium]